MLRGYQKQMVVLQMPESETFECAWLVLRHESTAVSHSDMLTEANRLIGAGVTVKQKKRAFPVRTAFFLLGLVVGAALFFAFSALLAS
ncbi:MAG: hypothetical protein IJW51_03875 [Clostridia bacterium]|nr:hypothetical protein [Clostridia bacterium]